VRTADTFNGLMVLPNLIGLLALSSIVKDKYVEFENTKAGKMIKPVNK